MLTKDEIKAAIVRAFDPPYHCGVEFFPLDDPYKEEVSMQVSEYKDDTLPLFIRHAKLEAAEEPRLLDELIGIWREEATKAGYTKLPPLP